MRRTRTSNFRHYVHTAAWIAGAATAAASCARASKDSGPAGPAEQPVASVLIATPPTALAVGTTAQLSATLKDATGDTLSGRSVTWKSSDSTRATVGAGGLVTGVATGSTTVSAASEGKTGTALITVTDSGTIQLLLNSAPASLGAAIITVSGGPILSVARTAIEEHHVIAVDGRSVTMLVRGALANGALATIAIPDRSISANYNATIVQFAAAGTYQQLSIGAATATLKVRP
jgi:hypothetical protein